MEISQIDLFLRCGAAIGIGFMIGLQREFAKGGGVRSIMAGERTFALLGLTGWMAAFISSELDSSLPFVVVLMLVGILASVSYFVDAWNGKVGLTTEVAIVVTILLGALCFWGHLLLAAAIGIISTVLLSLKLETDRFVRALTRDDISAALQLAVISAIILPILPNDAIFLPPFDVINPYKIWLMVVFISGISFVGYVAIKFVGPHQGIGLTGLLGGLVSSTAVTLSFSERSNREPQLSRPFALAITVAWTVMFARVLVEVGVINNALLYKILLPIVGAALIGLIYCAFLFLSQRTSEKSDIEFSNPFDLKSAIKFGLLYGLVLLISRAAQMYLGDAGIYISSIVSGAADVDAIALSMAELSKTGGLDLDTASTAVILATMSNTVVKGGIAIFGGSVNLRKPLIPAIILILIAGLSLTILI